MYELPDLRRQKIIRNPAELLRHLRSFHLDPKPSLGLWYFAPGGGRFHERYVPDLTIEQRLELAGKFAKKYGVRGVEAHYPAEVNEENLHLYKQLETAAGVRLAVAPFSHFYDKDFEFGSLSNPNPKIREKAVKIAVGCLKLVKAAGARCAISWPGIDGYTYPVGTFFPWMWDWFESAMAEALDQVPGVMVAIEPKPYEPAPNNIYRTTAEGILAAQRIEARLKNPENRRLLAEGRALVTLNPELGHVRMGFEDSAAAYSLCGVEGRLGHIHLNSQPEGNYDQDLNLGVVDWRQGEGVLWALKLMGYEGFYGIDINPERMPVETAVRLNVEALKIMAERVEALPHERLIECFLCPEKHRGEVEEILMAQYRLSLPVRSGAPSGAKAKKNRTKKN
jgi:xylose isomerase